MKRIIFILVLFFFGSNICAKEYFVQSLNKRIEVRVNVSNGVRYNVFFNNDTVLKDCSMSLNVLDDEKRIPLRVKKLNRYSVNEKIKKEIPLNGLYAYNKCNVLVLELNNEYAIEFRTFDNGFAYRYVSNKKGNIDIQSEDCSINFPENYLAHLSLTKSFWSSYEEPYSHVKTSSYSEKDKMTYLPVLLESPKGYNILISEADLKDYPCMFLKSNGNNGMIGAFPKTPLEFGFGNDRALSIKKEADYIARTSGKRSFPWRFFVISDKVEDIIENDMVYVLSSPSEVSDCSWIEPGQVSWEWWHDARLFGVDFKSGYNTDSYKYYIDFASKYGIPYILMDEGWAEDTRNPFIPNKNVDVHLLVKYAKERNVKIILWLPWLTVENNWELFKTFSDWGIAGVKIDFMNRSDQWMVNFYEKVAKEAAKNKLIVDFHGSFKPAGLERRYPNVLSYEGVLGLEMGARCTPSNSIFYPFIRNAVGAMDFTPGSMISAQPEDNKYTRANAMGSGTRAYQMALYVVFKSGLQMLADNPVYYYRENDCTEFITDIPVTWDETRILSAKIGEYIVLARKKGKDWYVGAITNDCGRSIDINLDFLDSKNQYELTSFSDGINADRQAMDYKKNVESVGHNDKVMIKMVRNGGWAGKLKALNK